MGIPTLSFRALFRKPVPTFRAHGVYYNATSLRIGDGPGSMVRNNGVPLAMQNTNADSALAGQPFNNYAWGGISSKTFGDLTYGRHKTVLADAVYSGEPQFGSVSFSPFGYSGQPAGGGDTENTRLDNSLKYNLKWNGLRFAALYKFGSNSPTDARNAYQIGLGLDHRDLSLDIVYSQINGAISASALSSSQASQPTFTNVWGQKQSTYGTLAATVSDNQAIMFGAKYQLDERMKLFAGYEYQRFSNPKHPIGASGIPSFLKQSIFI